MSLETEIACFWNLFPGLVYEYFQKSVYKYFSGEQEKSLETCCFLICKPQNGGKFFYDVLKLIFFKNNPVKTIFKNVFGKTSPLPLGFSFSPVFVNLRTGNMFLAGGKQTLSLFWHCTFVKICEFHYTKTYSRSLYFYHLDGVQIILHAGLLAVIFIRCTSMLGMRNWLGMWGILDINRS